MSDFNWLATQQLRFAARYSSIPQHELLGLSEWERGMQQFPFQLDDGWKWIEAT